MNNRTGNALRSLTAAATLLFLSAACNPAPPRPAEPAGADAAITADDSLRMRADAARVTGDTAAPLWIIVASDFQCPYCAQWHHESQQALRNEYVRPGKVRIAYLNFPLEQHAHAQPAANAALCAGAQGRFWEMHDAIFDTRDRWAALADASSVFDSLATAAGVNIGAWRECVASGVMNVVIASDRGRAASAGVQSTPTFLLTYRAGGRQGQLIRGAAPLTEFRRAIDSMLVAVGEN
jgi:protein-disulfide isomerase